MPQSPQRRAIETLQEHLVRSVGVAFLGKHFEHRSGDVQASPAVQPGPLQLHIQPGTASPASIEAGDQVDLLRQGWDGKQGRPQRKPVRVHRHLYAILARAAALVNLQLAQLLQREIHGVEATIGAGPAGEMAGHIGGAFQVDIVQDHGNAIPAQHHVLFDIVGAHGMCHGLGSQRVLRQVAAGPAMGDHDWGAGFARVVHKGCAQQ